MHYLTVIAIDVPQIEENEAENLKVKTLIKALKEDKPQEGNFLYDYRLEELEETQTTFARTVSDLAYEFMEPYGQDSENYQEFFDMTEELGHSYEHGKGDFIKTPDGRITSAFYVVGEHRFIIQNGKVYEQLGKGWKDRRFKRTKIAKKMKALVDFPNKKAYKTFDLYATECCGETYHEDKEAYGYYCNPNTCYDWCVVGGRWPNTFLVKEECQEVYICSEKRSYKKDAPAGYKWVAAARMKDIEWALMKQLEKDSQIKHYHLCAEYFAKGQVPPDTYYKLTEDGFRGFSDMAYVSDETLESFLSRHGVSDELQYPSICYAYIYDGEYHERWEFSTLERKGYDRVLIDWQKEVDEYLSGLQPDDVLVTMDIHI